MKTFEPAMVSEEKDLLTGMVVKETPGKTPAKDISPKTHIEGPCPKTIKKPRKARRKSVYVAIPGLPPESIKAPSIPGLKKLFAAEEAPEGHYVLACIRGEVDVKTVQQRILKFT